MNEFRELILQALYQYRKDIGWINSIDLDREVPTAQVDEFRNVLIGTKFFEDHLKSSEDIAFVLAHEASHQYAKTLLSSDFEINLRYSLLIRRGWETNYLEDLLINQSLFHLIPSNLPDRFYRRANWNMWFLQRKLDLFDHIEEQIELTKEQQDLLKLYRIACVDWYRDNNIINLYEVFKKAGDFLLTFPPQASQNLMVGHKEDSEKKIEVEELDLEEKELELIIPLVEDPIANSFKIEELSQTLTNLVEQISYKNKRIEDFYSQKRQEGYGNPSMEELIQWDLGIYQPWTEPQGNPETKDILVIFDVSGSMFKYLSLLNMIRSILKNHQTTYWAFSDRPKEIIFEEAYARVVTGFGTKLDAVLEILKDRERQNVFLITDCAWTLSKKYPLEWVERIIQGHNVTLFQRGTGKISYIPELLFEEIIHL